MGRLVEVRVEASYRTPADVDALFEHIAQVAFTSNDAVVIVADWRACPLLSSEASEHLLRRMMRNNLRVKRSAVLAGSGSAAAMLQFHRVVRDSRHPNRKVFTDTRELERWLGEELTPPEAARLHEFLADAQEHPWTRGLRAG